MPENNSAPLEVIAAPYKVWWSELGVDFPLIDAEPDDMEWNLIGSSGDLNYDDATGVTVTHNKTTVPWRSVGDTGVRKRFLTEQDQTVKLMLVDLTLEQYRLAMNHNAITTVPAGGEAGYKKMGLSRSTSIKTIQLLVRGPSPEMEDGAMQYEIPRCQESGNPEVALSKKGQPAGLALEFSTLVDTDAATPDEYFGRVVVQTAAAVS